MIDNIVYFHRGKWTRKDVEDVEILRQACLPYRVIGLRRHNGYISVYIQGEENVHMKPEFFPSLAMGEVTTLDMIKLED